MIVITILGVLAALAVVGVRSYLATARTAEAKQTVGAIARATVAQYERERDISQIMPAAGGSAEVTHILCGSATPVPSAFTSVQGKKYQPGAAPGADFATGSSIAGWQCLGFSISQPIYFQYSYQVGGNYVSQLMPGAPIPSGAEAFEIAALGDLDGDGLTCAIVRTGEVRNDEIAMSPVLFTNNDPD
ncbi:type IV pilin protein [Sorangium sp. So ce362]|uniref:type IV pilin protein n=1 Tax=Sorangium sp. So ce362 TaxID=3133303 RepID=UPI003F618F26